MFKLMEYQRQYKPLSSSQPLTTSNSTPIASPPPPSSLYTLPLASSVDSTSTYQFQSPYFTTTMPTNPIPTAHTASPLSASSTSSYLNTGQDNYVSLLSSSSNNEQNRPYVSAIRKRRTLFDEDISLGSSTTATPEDLNHSQMSMYNASSSLFYKPPSLYSNNNYNNNNNSARPDYYTTSSFAAPSTNDCNSYSNYTSGGSTRSPAELASSKPVNLKSTIETGSLNLNRPVSLETTSSKNEVTNANSLVATASAQQAINVASSASKLLKLKKSHSTNTKLDTNNTNNNSPPTTSIHTTVSNSAKIRSTVFDRLAALNSATAGAGSVNTTTLTTSPTTTSAAQPLSSISNGRRISNEIVPTKPPIRIDSSQIKLQNDIAIVTSMIPSAKRKDSLPSLNTSASSNSNAAISRMRSLDSKSREKFRIVSAATKEAIAIKKSSPTSSISSNEVVVPSCYLYPQTSSTSSSTSSAAVATSNVPVSMNTR